MKTLTKCNFFLGKFVCVPETGNDKQKFENRIGFQDIDKICAAKWDLYPSSTPILSLVQILNLRQRIISPNLVTSEIRTFLALTVLPLTLRPRSCWYSDLEADLEIAKVKKQDSSMKNVLMESLCKIIIGSTRSMGIEVVPGRDEDT